MRILLGIPCFNEEAQISQTVHELTSQFVGQVLPISLQLRTMGFSRYPKQKHLDFCLDQSKPASILS